MRYFAFGLSILFHPLLCLTYGLLLLLLANPYLFGYHHFNAASLLLIKCIAYTFLLPVLTTLLMQLLGLVRSLELDSREERFGPLIAALVFNTWFLVNVIQNPEVPGEFSVFVLGTCIALGLSFFLNVFTKISLHAVGLGGLLGMIIVMGWVYKLDRVGIGPVHIHFLMVIYLVCIIVGLVGSMRIYLAAHDKKEIYIGWSVGLVSILIALRYLS
ncbi:MAG: hypothetical protein OEQ53_01575 [Saprospiraceae bacterium]|nr:hypothetical protein [Saprospiraceae bacterium]